MTYLLCAVYVCTQSVTCKSRVRTCICKVCRVVALRGALQQGKDGWCCMWRGRAPARLGGVGVWEGALEVCGHSWAWGRAERGGGGQRVVVRAQGRTEGRRRARRCLRGAAAGRASRPAGLVGYGAVRTATPMPRAGARCRSRWRGPSGSRATSRMVCLVRVARNGSSSRK